MVDSYQKKESVEIIFYLWMLAFRTVILPLAIGLSLLGFEESFVNGKPLEFGSLLASYLIYTPFIIGSIFLVIYPIANLIFIKKGQHPATQENPKWYRIFTVSLIHNPEQGAFYTLFRKLGLKKNQNFAKWTLSIIELSIISMIIFASLGALSLTFPQAQVTGIPNAVFQQVTPISEVLFISEPAAFSETATMMFLFLFLLGINAYICAKFRLGIGTFFLIGFVIICPIMGLFWQSIHSIVYAASDQARFATFVFGWLGSTLTLATASFIPWISWHFWNNVFAKMAEIAPGNADVVFFSWLGIFSVASLYVGFKLWLFFKKRKKKEEGFIEPTF